MTSPVELKSNHGLIVTRIFQSLKINKKIFEFEFHRQIKDQGLNDTSGKT